MGGCNPLPFMCPWYEKTLRHTARKADTTHQVTTIVGLPFLLAMFKVSLEYPYAQFFTDSGYNGKCISHLDAERQFTMNLSDASRAILKVVLVSYATVHTFMATP